MQYNNKITLIKNKRGIYDLDTTKGCYHGMHRTKKGCYGECYAARSSKQYGYNFNKTVNRYFENVSHLEKIRDQIMNIDMPFVRIGVSGDPSENWKNTIQVIKLIHGCNKKVVIITKHWQPLTISQINDLSKFDVCINTSISAIDNPKLLKYRLQQYKILKHYLKSILRIVSCDFNTKNLTGLYYNYIQNMLFDNDNVLDNALRVSINNNLLKLGIINVEKVKFLNNESLISMTNKNTFIGYCNKCTEMCGINS